MTITRNFKLCLNAGTGSAPYINVNQYDRGETWLFELYNEDGTRYTPSTGAIIGLKSDGHAIMNNGTVDSDGRVVITETEQMTAAAGRSVFELSIDGLTHGTANFIVKAERKPFDEGAMSDSDISMLQEVIDASEVINEVIGEGGDPSQRITDAVDDWLDSHPEATTTVQDGAITAPKINSSLWDKLLVNEEASGNPASFEDGADDVPVSSLKVALEPIQTGTGDPSPTNIRPISGHSSVTVDVTGGNLIDLAGKWSENATHYGYTAMLPAGTYYAYIFTEGNEAAYNSIAKYSLDGTTYTDILTTDNGYAVCDATMQHNRKKSRITLHQSAYIRIGLQGVKHVNRQIYVLLTPNGSEYDSMPNVPPYAYASTMWMPYVAPTQYHYTLGQSVYGGTVDLATGVLTVTHGYVDMGSLNWSASSTAHCFYANFGTYPQYKISSNVQLICSQYKYDGTRNASPYFGDNETLRAYSRTNALSPSEIYVRDDRFTAVADFKTAVTGQTICYELATPTTVQLTPQEVTTLLGENNIFADTGEVEVTYRADTKRYIDEQTKATKNIIAGVETSFTATKNYTTGNLMIVGDDLYRVTSNIANGSAITPNTNVTKTTVAEQLLALA